MNNKHSQRTQIKKQCSKPKDDRWSPCMDCKTYVKCYRPTVGFGKILACIEQRPGANLKH